MKINWKPCQDGFWQRFCNLDFLLFKDNLFWISCSLKIRFLKKILTILLARQVQLARGNLVLVFIISMLAGFKFLVGAYQHVSIKL